MGKSYWMLDQAGKRGEKGSKMREILFALSEVFANVLILI